MIKRIIILSLLFLALISPCWATDYTQDANCQAAYLMDEGSGTTISDSSQNTNTANFKGDGEPAWDSVDIPSKSYISNCVDFDGSDDYLYCGDDSSTNFVGNTEDFTVVWWNKYAFGNTYERYFTRQNGATGDGWGIVRNSGAGVMLVVERSGDQDGLFLGSDLSTSWTPYAFQYDWSEDKGRLLTSGSVTIDWTTLSTAATFDWASDDDLYIGARKTDASTQCESRMTEIGLFNRILTPTEVNDIIDNGLAAVAAKPQLILITE